MREPEHDRQGGGDDLSRLEVALAVDWRLGQSDVLSACVLWLIVAGVAAYGLVILAWSFQLLAESLDDVSYANAAKAVLAYGFGLGIIGCADLARAYLSGGRRGRWGRFVGDLVLRHRGVECELLARCEVLPGIRWRLRRRAVVLVAPGRLLVVAREWNPWIVALVFAPGLTMVGLAWVRSAGDPVLPLWPAGLGFVLAFLTVCRRTQVHAVPVPDLGEPETTDEGVRLGVARGPLRPDVVLRGRDDEARRRLHDRVTEVLASEAAPAEDPDLTRLESFD